MRRVMSVLAYAVLAAAFLSACSSEEDRDTGTGSPRPVFKKTGKLKPIHSGFKSHQTSTKYIKMLIKRFDGTDESRRAAALDEVVEIGRPAIQFLEATLKHRSAPIREYVCQALGRIARMPGSFMMNKLVAKLGDPEVRVIRAACFAIGHIGTKDTATAKKVFVHISHPNPTVRSYAAECLRKLHYWPAIPALIFNHLAPAKTKKGEKAGAKKKSPAAKKPVGLGLEYTNPLRAYAADALAHITHVDYGTDYRMWRKWWVYNQDRYTSDWRGR